MNVLEATFLGVVQGLTEFLPVSSSGHLVALESLLRVKRANSVTFEVVLHLGTLCAIVVIYRRELFALARYCLAVGAQHAVPLQTGRLLLLIAAATVPTGVIGVVFKKALTGLFDKPNITGVMLMVTGIILLLSRLGKTRWGAFAAMPVWAALLIGVIQGVAIIPGISRSGSTIALGLLLGLERRHAADFSFILSVPAVIGAVILSLNDIENLAAIGAGALFAGFLASFAAGIIAVLLVLRIVRGGKLWYFAPYCFVLGAVIALFA
jgi:undecaprenyl-diphosphatase